MAGLDHVSLCVSDVKRALPFYKTMLEFLGLRLAHATDAIAIFRDPAGGPGFNLWQAKPEFAERKHQIYAPGYHHLAFSAGSRADVDALHVLLRDTGFAILDPPQAYDHYGPGYYAVYFTDPDGMKFELAHVPPRQ